VSILCEVFALRLYVSPGAFFEKRFHR